MHRPDPSELPAEHLARMLSRQAMACRALGSPMYADLLSWAAADLQSGGPTADMLDGYLAQPVSSVLPLRMLGAAHALALTGGWQGAAPPDSRIEVVGRTGGDLDPIDPTTPAGALTLTAYVWPDQRSRLAPPARTGRLEPRPIRHNGQFTATRPAPRRVTEPG